MFKDFWSSKMSVMSEVCRLNMLGLIPNLEILEVLEIPAFKEVLARSS